MPRARGMVGYMRDGYEAFRQPKFVCGCCEMKVFMVCGKAELILFNRSRNPDIDEQINDGLLHQWLPYSRACPCRFLVCG